MNRPYEPRAFRRETSPRPTSLTSASAYISRLAVQGISRTTRLCKAYHAQQGCAYHECVAFISRRLCRLYHGGRQAPDLLFFSKALALFKANSSSTTSWSPCLACRLGRLEENDTQSFSNTLGFATLPAGEGYRSGGRSPIISQLSFCFRLTKSTPSVSLCSTAPSRGRLISAGASP